MRRRLSRRARRELAAQTRHRLARPCKSRQRLRLQLTTCRAPTDATSLGIRAAQHRSPPRRRSSEVDRLSAPPPPSVAPGGATPGGSCKVWRSNSCTTEKDLLSASYGFAAVSDEALRCGRCARSAATQLSRTSARPRRDATYEPRLRSKDNCAPIIPPELRIRDMRRW